MAMANFRPSVSMYLDDIDDNDKDDTFTRSRQDTETLLNDPMMKMKWYHPFLTRHAAECMLIDNAPEGCYLLRPSTSGNINEYALSVKFSQSVQHIKINKLSDGKYQFGQSTFSKEDTLRRHFELEKPIIGGENNVKVTLKYPYSREIDEQHKYTELHHHAATNMVDLDNSDSDTEDTENSGHSWDACDTLQRFQYITPISSREGYLTKRGRIRKSWKVRWFVLRNTNLSYYKTKQSKKPISVINMLAATSVDYDTSTNKDYCFRVVLPNRTYFIYANTNEDCEQWTELLQSKVHVKRDSHLLSRSAEIPNGRSTYDPISTPLEPMHDQKPAVRTQNIKNKNVLTEF